MNLIAGLLRHAHHAGLTHDDDFHFAGAGQLVFDRLGDVAGQLGGFTASRSWIDLGSTITRLGDGWLGSQRSAAPSDRRFP